jgi:hypothetical protein
VVHPEEAIPILPAVVDRLILLGDMPKPSKHYLVYERHVADVLAIEEAILRKMGELKDAERGDGPERIRAAEAKKLSAQTICALVRTHWADLTPAGDARRAALRAENSHALQAAQTHVSLLRAEHAKLSESAQAASPYLADIARLEGEIKTRQETLDYLQEGALSYYLRIANQAETELTDLQTALKRTKDDLRNQYFALITLRLKTLYALEPEDTFYGLRPLDTMDETGYLARLKTKLGDDGLVALERGNVLSLFKDIPELVC